MLCWQRPLIAVVFTAGLAALAPKPASATPITFDLSTGNVGGVAGFTAPYAKVTVALTGQTATITVAAQTNASYDYVLGGSGIVGLNVNSDSFTASAVGDITYTQPYSSSFETKLPAFSYNCAGGASTCNINSFGPYNLALKNQDGFKQSVGSLTLNVTNDSATPWSTAADVLTPNSPNNSEAVAHIYVADATQSPIEPLSTTPNTGYAAGTCVSLPGTTGCGQGTVVETPEPSSLALLGGALAAFGLALGLRERKRRQHRGHAA